MHISELRAFFGGFGRVSKPPHSVTPAPAPNPRRTLPSPPLPSPSATLERPSPPHRFPGAPRRTEPRQLLRLRCPSFLPSPSPSGGRCTRPLPSPPTVATERLFQCVSSALLRFTAEEAPPAEPSAKREPSEASEPWLISLEKQKVELFEERQRESLKLVTSRRLRLGASESGESLLSCAHHFSSRGSHISFRSESPTQRRSQSNLNLDSEDVLITAFGSFVPRLALRQLTQTLAATWSSSQEEQHLGRVTDACVIFADASGFTALTEHLDALPNGAELMCAIMNRFLGTVIDVVHRHGGDVIKFAGDAVSCMFQVAAEPSDDRPEVSPDMRTAVLRAACCALELHRKLHNHAAYTDGEGKTIHLSLHIGLSCGCVTLLHLGGHQAQWEFVLAGEPQNQACEAETRAESGETCIASVAWALIADVADGVPCALEDDAASTHGHIFMLLKGVHKSALPYLPMVPPLARLKISPTKGLLPLLRRYVPLTVALKLQDGLSRELHLSEMRQVSVMFVNVQGARLAARRHVDIPMALSVGQEVMDKIQAAVHHLEGQVNKMLIDDKGTVFLCVFGLPPRPHADDALRAVKLALLLKQLMCGDGHGKLRACVGIGSGRAFCGVVGSSERREFTTMGDVVNLSARLMGMASMPGAEHRLLVDEATHAQSSASISYHPLPPTKLKGKQHALPLFVPLHAKATTRSGTTVGLQGRDFEYRQLRWTVAELLVYEGAGTIILCGARGSGKKVLVDALVSFGKQAGMIVLHSSLHAERVGAHQHQQHSRRHSALRSSLRSSCSERRSSLQDDDMPFGAWRDILRDLLSMGAQETGRSETEFVRQALLADLRAVRQDETHAEGGLKEGSNGRRHDGVTPSVVAEERVMLGQSVRAARRGGLVKWGWLLNDLLPDEHPKLGFLPPTESTSADLGEVGWSLLAVLLALLSYLGGTRRVMVLLHLQTGTWREHKLDIWSWRTAHAVAQECRAAQLGSVLMCLVTRQIARGFDASSSREIECIFHDISLQAERSSSLLKLLPLSTEARERYLVQVLTERYGYSGSADAVPRELFDFVSGRTAGNPKHIEEMLKALFDAEALSFELNDEGPDDDAVGGMYVTCGDLAAVEAPAKIKATLLQQFDTLAPAVQVLLKMVSPLRSFSEGMMVQLGLPEKIVKRLPLWLASAVDEGFLEVLSPVPADVLEADPGAKQAWGWLQLLMKQEILSSMLSAERQAIERKVAKLKEYHQNEKKRNSGGRTPRGSCTKRPSATPGASNGSSRGAHELDELAGHTTMLRLYDPSATVEELQRELAKERHQRKVLEQKMRDLYRESGSRVCHLM